MASHAHAGEKVYQGIAVSPGVCRGKVVLAGKKPGEIPQRILAEEEVAPSLDRFHKALLATRQQLIEVQRRVREDMGAADANIFDAHLLVLEDQTLIEEVTRQVRDKRVNVEYALKQVTERYVAVLGAVEDEYLKERAHDMEDVVGRILSNLTGKPSPHQLPALREPSIIVARDLAPSATAVLDKKLVLGFATDTGSKTSHTAILGRSLQIPAVAGLKDFSEIIEDGQFVLLDGYNGVVIVNPTDQTLFEYGQLVRR